jgi:hypothetical protein
VTHAEALRALLAALSPERVAQVVAELRSQEPRIAEQLPAFPPARGLAEPVRWGPR